jgi:hypothetical protein
MPAALAGVTSGGLSATKPLVQPEAGTAAVPSATSLAKHSAQRVRPQQMSLLRSLVPQKPAPLTPSQPPRHVRIALVTTPGSLLIHGRQRGSSGWFFSVPYRRDQSRTRATDWLVFDDEVDPIAH